MRKLMNLLGRPLAAIAREWERMAPRERRLAAVALLVAGLAVCGVGGYLFSSSLAEVEEGNEEIRRALKAIARNRTEYLEAKQKMRAMELRIGEGAPQLATDLDAIAREVGIQIPETVERQPAAVGRRYLEHNVDVKLRQVDLKQLAKFLSRLETSRRLIYVTRLRALRRFAERDKLDVELTATAVERLKQDLPDKKGKPRTRT